MLDIRVVPASSRRPPDVLALPVGPSDLGAVGAVGAVGADGADSADRADGGPEGSSGGGPPGAGPVVGYGSFEAELGGELTAYLPDLGSGGRAHVGDAGRVDVLPRPGRQPRRVYLVGTGAGGADDLRRAAAVLTRAAGRERRLVSLLGAGLDPAALRAVVEGAGLAAYRYTVATGSRASGLRRLDLAVPEPGDPSLLAAVERALATVRAVCWARDLVNTPALEKSPAWLANQADRQLTPLGVRVVTREPDWLAANRFGGLLAVGGGASRPPRLITAAWRPRGAATHAVLVGKGITFDSGGISIKPADAMVSMKTDMAGGAAALGAVHAAAALRLPIRVTALVPAAENSVSGSSYRPADVLRHPNGRTTEVLNTDAEGRLVLADALAYASARLAPDLLVDLATLTGATKIALGLRTAGLFATDDRLASQLTAAGVEAGEDLWRMPLIDAYGAQLKSEIADAVNAPGGGAGGITAALFLRPFVGSVPWAHLDIAGPARAGADDADISRGGTGYGVRTLLRWLEGQAAA